MTAPSSPYSECSTLSTEFEFVIDPRVLKMLVAILTARHGQPTNMGIRYTLHDSKLIAKRMIFATRVAFAPRVADMLRYLYLRALQGSAEENTLLNVRPALADICRNSLADPIYLQYIIESEITNPAHFCRMLLREGGIVA
ncbi:hypothetical protein C8R48DRAFT_779291 [Suillus tomentosus]|nr:hypothetical protein C8R48DRAFT_779291 [Suillus tomentosus]